MLPGKIRVLVVDDSLLVREMIADVIRGCDDLELAGLATDGRDALRQFEHARPDVVTLDVQMPCMNGLETLDALLAKRPVPVIMVSALTSQGADTTLAALERGALDFIAKPEGLAQAAAVLQGDLVRKIRLVACANVARVLENRRVRAKGKPNRPVSPLVNPPAPLAGVNAGDLADKCIALGISTGGPSALATLFEGLRPPLPPLVMVQHMPPHFTRSLANRLHGLSPIAVKEAENGDLLEPNCAYLARGGQHLALRRQMGAVRLHVYDGEPVSGHRPSVDVLMASVAPLFGRRCLGVIMTGMGRDGVHGCRDIRAAGGMVLGQDEATSDVYGMNRAAFVEGHVDRQFGLNEAASVIMQHVQRRWSRIPAGTA